MTQMFVNKLFQILEILIEDQKQVDKFYELAFQIAISEGNELYAYDVGNLKCIEIDTPDDMDAANVLIQHLRQISNIEISYERVKVRRL